MDFERWGEKGFGLFMVFGLRYLATTLDTQFLVFGIIKDKKMDSLSTLKLLLKQRINGLIEPNNTHCIRV